MIYFVIVLVIVTFIEIKYKKSIKSKKDITFYIVCTVLAIGMVIFYYQDPFRLGLTEHILQYLNLGGIN